MRTWVVLLASMAAQGQVVVERGPQRDVALQLAVEELRAALKSHGGRVALDGPLELRDDRQEFEIEPGPGRLTLRSGGVGLVYGAFRLAEMIRRDGFHANLRLKASPAFAERMFSYQGTILDLPDEAYYFRDKPYVNPYVVKQQTEAARESMRAVVKYGFNSITFLHLNIEDYVNYDKLGGGYEVYAADSLHRARSEIFCRMLRELADYAHQLHLRLYIQIYDLSFPDHLDGRQLTDDSEYTWRMVDAKFTEMLERTGVDGIVVTATEPSPRLNYRGFQLWKTPEGAGRMAARYQDIIVKKNKRRMIFRMWRVANDMETFERVLKGAPDPGIMYDAKHTDGDFFLPVGANKLLEGGAPKKRRFMITFDVFREFDGWGRTVFYPNFWGERFKMAARNGVAAVDAWGPWAPGCIYPGVWAGKYDEYDFLRHGHSTALATLYLFMRLAWDPETPVEQIRTDWARLNFGVHAPAAEKALALSAELWGTTYIGPQAASQFPFKWTMLFQPRTDVLPKVAGEWTLDTVRKSDALARDLAEEIRKLAAGVDPATSPNPAAAREFRRAAELTHLYFRTFTKWRELIYRDWRGGTEEDRQAILRLAGEIEQLLPEWRRYPREAKDWLVFQYDPDLATAPAWMRRTSLAETVREIKGKHEKQR